MGRSRGRRDHKILLRLLSCLNMEMEGFFFFHLDKEQPKCCKSMHVLKEMCLCALSGCGQCVADHPVSCWILQGSGHKLCLDISAVPEKESRNRV